MAKFDEIIKTLQQHKENDLSERWEALKKKKFQIEPVDLKKKLDIEQKEIKLKTGTLIDDMIGGGLEPEASMLLFGEYGSGKSQTCFTMSVLCPDHVVYIDTEGSFKVERIVEICKTRGLDWKELLSGKITLYQPKNWMEQMIILRRMVTPTDVGKIGLVIMDSLTKLFRGVEFAGRQSLQAKQPLVRETILAIEDIAKSYRCGFVYTTQIYEDPNKNAFLPDWTGHKPVGGASILHQPDYVILFRRKVSSNVRIARLLDASWQPLRERPFAITEKGIENLPETEKAEKLIEKTEKYEEKVVSGLDGTKKEDEKKAKEE
jgi:DNA repair protein RadA